MHSCVLLDVSTTATGLGELEVIEIATVSFENDTKAILDSFFSALRFGANLFFSPSVFSFSRIRILALSLIIRQFSVSNPQITSAQLAH